MVKQINSLNLWDYRNKFPLSEKCIASWSKTNPDAKIKIWTEKDDFIKDKFNNSPLIKYILNHSEYSPYRKRIIISDYLKLCILYTFGGVFVDLDIELYSKISFTKSFSMNLSRSIAICNPTYFAEPKSPLLQELIQQYETPECHIWSVPDWEMCSQSRIPEKNQNEFKSLLKNGLYENVQFNHWITFYKEGDKAKFWDVFEIDSFKYFNTQQELDNYLSKNLLLDIMNEYITYKFIFVNPSLIVPFLWSTSQRIKIFKCEQSEMTRYVNYYLTNEVQKS
jgi:mannosyltransferase OCH1-like enzyme